MSIILFNLHGQSSDYQEEVHLAVNTTNILVGESLSFSAFVYSNATKNVSALSSILYIELVDESGRSVSKTKIGLRKGRGAGNMYIDPDWMSGTYRIRAYTRWMMNYESFYEQKVLILNPYSGITVGESISGDPIRFEDTMDGLTVYQPAQDVSLNIGSLEPSTLSIAITKATKLYYPNEIELNNKGVEMRSFEKLPEYRYGLVQGKISKPSGELNQLRVNMIIKGSSMQVATTKTDKYGRFWMSYNPDYCARSAEVQVYVEDDSVSQIILVNEYYENHTPLDSVYTAIDSIIAKEIIERSIHSQVQRAYEGVEKPISNDVKNYTLPSAEVYYLDDFRRFSSVRDTFIELIKYVGVSKSEGNYRMNVRCAPPDGLLSANKSPLILLDGLEVSSQDILSQSPNEIEKIEIVPEYYFVNDIAYKGVISVHTFGRKDLETRTRGLKFPIANYQPYSDDSNTILLNENHPHYESDLLWNPIYKHAGGLVILDFATSRLTGTYKISISGISNTGRAINLTRYFKVSDSVATNNSN
ncbi:hypothetical protein [Ekhidna sp.]|uniref:hypothetical protein n=1 Tax=Ekhidna sp. TaxID=2608089 RepID=UPI003CCC3DE4